ncbi:MAG: O-antigen ligase family protein [Solirubrobacteraceae bacterium]
MIFASVLAFAALSGPLPKAGVIAVTLLAAAVLLARAPRARAVAMLGALVLAPVLLLSEIWSSPQLAIVHRHPLEAAVGGVVALCVLGAVAALFVRRPALMAVLAVAALPFRVPIQSGGTTSNLLVPLYLVVAAGALAWIWRAARSGGDAERAQALGSGSRAVDALLALYLLLYGIQAIYSPNQGFEKALQNAVFFYVPFALLYRLLCGVRWSRRLLIDCLRVTVALALVFAAIGFYEYATKTIILNPKLVVANDLHTYFTVNSVFFDPDIFGRYLALAMILLAVALIYERRSREQGAVIVVLAILWACLVLTLSRSSLGALLVGMAVLAALRWRPGRAVLVAVAVVVLGVAAVAVAPRTFGINQGLNNASSGRGGLVSGGLSLVGQRPVWGWGSGSFVTEYRAHHRHTPTALSASHTIPVTVAAEQGLIGELSYAALVIAAIVCLVRAARGDPARSAVAAAFIALVFHTMLYADFLEDPTTWVLLGVGVALASAKPAAIEAAAPERGTRADVPWFSEPPGGRIAGL